MRPVALAAAALVATAVLGGCTGSSSSSSQTAGAGDRLEIMYSFEGAQAQGFREAVDAWAKEHGVSVSYVGSADLAADITARERSGQLPDVLVVPQPGLLQQLREHGTVEPVDDFVPVGRIASDLVPGLLPPLQHDGRTYAVPVSMNVKSLLWYDRHTLHALDVDPPRTMAELQKASARLLSAHRTPWCLGLSDGEVSGWAGTDWVEELVLKDAGPQVYDRWVAGQVPFSDPRVRAAFQSYADLVLGPGQVEGGGAAAATRDVRRAADGMFAAPQGCALLKQGSYVTQQGFLPDRVRRSLDQTTSVLAFPRGTGDAIEVGGDSAALLKGAADPARGLVRYLATDTRFGADWAGSEDRGFISPHKTFDLERYSSTTTRKIASAAYQATAVRFDASDQMPPAVGQQAFWAAMLDLTSGKASVDQVVTRLDAARS